MHNRLIARLAAAASLVAVSSLAPAQWSIDPAANQAVAPAGTTAVLPKIAPTADGGAYVGWFESVPGPTFYKVRLQRYDACGRRVFAADGLLISDKPQLSSTVDWDLRSDAQNHALIAFTDDRAGGGDRDIVAYRISPTGEFVWGNDGVLLSNNSNFEADPRIVQTSDGNYTVLWPRTVQPANQPPRGLVIQRLDPLGNKLLTSTPDEITNGLLVAGSGLGGTAANEVPALADIVASDNASIIAAYARDTRQFSSPRHPTVQKFSPTGQALWNAGAPLVLNAFSMPIAPRIRVVSDNAGGCILTWSDTRRGGNNFDAWVQRVDSAGAIAFPAGGSVVSTNTADRIHISPTDAVPGPDGSVYVFWQELNAAQSQWGLFGNRFDPAGNRLWTDSGFEFAPVDTVNEDFIRAVPAPSGDATVLYFSASGTPSATVRAARVNSAGTPVWSPSPVTIASTPSTKGRLPAAALSTGAAIAAWEDSRSGSTSIFAQRVLPDGSLGQPPCPGDFNCSGGATVQDIFEFLAAWFAGLGNADFNGVSGITVQDIFDFLAAWFTGC
jgi:hypothetical protein